MGERGSMPFIESIRYPEEDANVVEITLVGCSVSLVNSIRRTIMNNVETLAIKKIEVEENSGIMHDDQLSHRFEFLPICLVEGASLEADDNRLDGPVASFECHGVNEGLTIMEAFETIHSDLIQPIYNCEMNHLFKGHSVKGQIYVEYGCGEKNCKFSPVSSISFSNGDPGSGDDSLKWILKYESMGTIEPAHEIFTMALDFLATKILDVEVSV